MKPRERILKTLEFEPVDRLPYDLIEGILWPDLLDYFKAQYGLETQDQVIAFIDPDIRWVKLDYRGPQAVINASQHDRTYSQAIALGPLYDAETIDAVLDYSWPDPAWWTAPDFKAARARFPDYALALLAWRPLFLTACDIFGMEGALVKMLTHPQVFEAAIARTHAINMDILMHSLKAAQGLCDICWLGDDFAGQQAMLMNPKLWRSLIKPYLAEEVQLVRDHGMAVMYHSCGAVRAVLPDLIEIGVKGLGVFQTTAAGMEVESIAEEFGGQMVFYGGIDVQQLLSNGSIEEVKQRVRRNERAFASCGGYIVANSHRIDTIKGENLVAMCHEAILCVDHAG